ncbi:hypothetical protein ElyMa_005512400 [Elysia marginata]|uniref:Uncharacterized protein n=1 Tax=Elysia marginata TaxID=1093978 RepID=A0AAV4EUV7_9GAST|nr:hypothetical protein ElyMa_005512400 [Elysia marginata]
MARGQAGLGSQSPAVQFTLPIGVITSYVIDLSEQEINICKIGDTVLRKLHGPARGQTGLPHRLLLLLLGSSGCQGVKKRSLSHEKESAKKEDGNEKDGREKEGRRKLEEKKRKEKDGGEKEEGERWKRKRGRRKMEEKKKD